MSVISNNNLSFPVLSLRKDIWTHFPVILTPLGVGTDGAERHAVVWHRKRLVEWRGSAAKDAELWSDYEEITSYRLMKCLRASARWVVEPAATDGQICVIRMLYGDQAPTLERHEELCEHVPVLTRLNDIKLYFPVVWHKVDPNQRMFAIELHGKKLKECGMVEGELRQRLEKALRASGSWRVHAGLANSKEVCRLELN